MKKIALSIIFFAFYMPAHKAISDIAPFVTGPQVGHNSCNSFDVPILAGFDTGQSFTAVDTARLEQIKVWLVQNSSEMSVVELKLYEYEGFNGKLLGTSALPHGIEPGKPGGFVTFEWKIWNRPDIILTKGKVYTFKIEYTQGEDAAVASCFNPYPDRTLYFNNFSTQDNSMPYEVITSHDGVEI